MGENYDWLTDEVMAAEVADPYYGHEGFEAFLSNMIKRGDTSKAFGDTSAMGAIKTVPIDVALAHYTAYKSRQAGAAVPREVKDAPHGRCHACGDSLGAVAYGWNDANGIDRWYCDGCRPATNPFKTSERRQTVTEWAFDTDRAHALGLAQRAARDAERERRGSEWSSHVAADSAIGREISAIDAYLDTGCEE